MPQPPVVRLGKLELIVLDAIRRLGDDAYGAAIQRHIAANAAEGGPAPQTAAIHTVLRRLTEKRFISSRWTAARPERGGRSRRVYHLLAAGRAAASAAPHAIKPS